MTELVGVAIEYFFGIYFFVVSIKLVDNTNSKGKHFVFDWVLFIAGVLLLAGAYFGRSMIR